ncbi:CoA transferase subunit A [Atopobacter phocae]|uniref:CoA transferase subunit A n=1 Tax=Atopobacter phocae TaxID=136492 RepID=UPI00046E8CE9|nr:CoA transferase subunit A [Atopobacter phocae]
MKNKLTSFEQAISKIKDGSTIMIGGFLGVGAPDQLIQALIDHNIKDITLISNDTGFVDKSTGLLIANKLVKKVYATHIGTNKETGRQMFAGETEVVLVPQGTLAEKIRAAGFGLGGVLTPTGVGTEVAVGKQIITIKERDYLLEEPLHADVALLFANTVDTFGNMSFHGSTQNFNNVMATAADYVVVEAEQVVSVGEMSQDAVHVPGIFVDAIVQREDD